jgi:putative transposase
MVCLSDLVQKVKANSSRWINQQKFVRGKFQWQEGYGAFSYGRSQRDVVIKYTESGATSQDKIVLGRIP